MTQEALKLALEALKTIDEAMPFPVAKLAQAAIKEALAQTQEPVAWREFIEQVAKQKPEKPDYWSSCSQCERNINDAEDLLEATPPQRTEPESVQQVGTIGHIGNGSTTLTRAIAPLLSKAQAQAQPEQEPVAVVDDVRKVAQAMQKDGYRGPLAWASKVLDFVADYTTPPQRIEQDGQCKRCTDGCPACDATKLQKESHDLL